MKQKFPRSLAMRAASEICRMLRPVTLRLVVAGSLRRGCLEVGDVEILYIPQMGSVRDLFSSHPVNLTDRAIDLLVKSGTLNQRKGANGRLTGWGDKNKFAVHQSTGIPVDFFATNEKSWFNYLVCRTGPAELNTEIALRAQSKGWRWTPYGPGFKISGSGDEAEEHIITSEAAVFEFVGLPPMTPDLRQVFKHVSA